MSRIRILPEAVPCASGVKTPGHVDSEDVGAEAPTPLGCLRHAPNLYADASLFRRISFGSSLPMVRERWPAGHSDAEGYSHLWGLMFRGSDL